MSSEQISESMVRGWDITRDDRRDFITTCRAARTLKEEGKRTQDRGREGVQQNAGRACSSCALVLLAAARF